MTWIEYTIQPGQSNFRPVENPMPRWANGFKIEARLDESCWWSEEDWQYDKDRQDWNKLKGLTWYFSSNKRCSAMIVWRPGKLENVFEITAYTNDKRGNFTVTGNPVEVYAGENFQASAEFGRRAIQYNISSFGRTSIYTHAWRRPWLRIYREVGTYVGGANNSPGQYGGQATQPMKMWAKFSLI